jgi:streptogramin lyase/predicted Ser/Thr protein kinase
MPAVAHLPADTTIAGYRIEGVAGEGGMGVVYRATQVGLERRVALKLITPDLGDDEEFRERFKRESKMAASIEHPHVIPVHEAGEADGRLFISMRYIEGTDLRTMIIEQGRVEPARASRILSQVASALDAAHARGLVHRDIKPGNVLIASEGDADHAFLTDFGLTKQSGSQSGLTRTGTWVGTLDYIAPEQIMGGHVDARSDVYALGCVLFHMLTGKVPYQRDSDVAKLWSHMNDPPPRLSEAAPELAKELDVVIGRAMAKDPDDRYPSATDFARAVEAALEGTDVAQPERSVAKGAAAPSRASTALRRSPEGDGHARSRVAPFAAGAVAAALLGGAVLAAAGAFSGDDEAPGSAQVANAISVSPITVDNPSGIAIGDGKAWVSSYERDRVTPIDEQTGRPGKSLETGDGPAGLALGDGSLWISQTSAGNIARLDLGLNRLVGSPTPLASGDGDVIEVGEGAVWAANTSEEDPEVGRIDPGTGKLTKRIPIRQGAEGDIAVGEGGVWVVNRQRSSITYIDARRAEVEGAPITVGRPVEDFAGEVAVGAGAVWATSPEDDTVSRIDPESRKVVETIKISSGVGDDLAVGLGSVWVVDDSSFLVRIDPATNAQVGAPVAGSPGGSDELEVGEDALWLSGATEGSTVLRIEP